MIKQIAICVNHDKWQEAGAWTAGVAADTVGDGRAEGEVFKLAGGNYCRRGEPEEREKILYGNAKSLYSSIIRGG